MPLVERDMIDVGGAEGVQLTLSGNEQLPIPFSFITVASNQSFKGKASSTSKEAKEQGGTGWIEAVRTIDVSFVSASHGNVVVVLQLQVHVQPLTVDRVIRFYQGEGQILRRCIRFHAGPPAVGLEQDDDQHDGTKYVHCIEAADQGERKNVIVEWRQADGVTVRLARCVINGSAYEVRDLTCLDLDRRRCSSSISVAPSLRWGSSTSSSTTTTSRWVFGDVLSPAPL